MSGTAWLIVFGFTALAGVAGFVLELFNNSRSSDSHPVSVGIVSALVAFFINWAVIYAGLPYFTWWSIEVDQSCSLLQSPSL